MSTIDPGKLKVAELKSELTSRGLDTKGVKAVLVQRLKEALEKESETALPDTSITETSTEDVNDSQESVDSDKDDEPLSEEPISKVSLQKSPVRSEKFSPKKTLEEKVLSNSFEETIQVSKKPELIETASDFTPDNVDKQVEPMEEDLKPDEPPKQTNTTPEVKPSTEDKPAPEDHPKGEKRPRGSSSPQRAARRRSRSPIKEDEPEQENEKVFLSWYDSDLNLQIDKQSFLSAKPFHEGAFGYSWAGARTTHGVNSGKVCYELKITEELKWEDIVRQLDRKRENQKSDRRDRRRNDRKGRESIKKGPIIAKPDSQDDGKEKPAESKDNENSSKEKEATVSTDTKDDTAEEKIENIIESAKMEVTLDASEEKKTEDDVVKEQTGEIVVTNTEESVVSDVLDGGEVNENGNDEVNKNNKEERAEEKQEPMEVDVPVPVTPITKHVIRCGWSVSGTPLQLGETKYSYGFDSHGKFVNNNEFVNYGASFVVGDVIGAYASIDAEKVELTYTINGISQGLAIRLPRSELPEENFILFPHILTRNMAFELNLGTRDAPWFPTPPELSDYVYIQALEDKLQGPLKPASRNDCEVIMMCGLPGSGKSYWVQEILKENPDKTYTIIGTSHLLQKMTINGKPLKESYKNRWNIILDRLMKCTNTLVDKAAVRRRNFIIDQTNVFPSAQRRKMRLFQGFKRHAVVVIVNDEEQLKRRAQQEAQDGKDVPDSALLEMKANMTLPKCCDWLEEVRYVELGEEEAKGIVQKYNSEGKAAGFGGFIRRGGFRNNRGQSYKWNRNNSRRDYRDNYRDSRPYQNSRFRSPGGFQDRRSTPDSWNRDFRDSRGPPRDPRSNRPGSGDRRDRPPRDRNISYNRNSRSEGGRYQGSSWQGSGGGGWQGSGQSWGGPQGGSSYQNWGQGSWSGQNQWKGAYGQGGYGQSGYGNWNYYGQQYTNNWQVRK